MILKISSVNSTSFNIATEEYLFKEYKENVLFIYINDSSVILGSNQVVQNEVNLKYCKKASIPVIRRLSGGGAVYHDLGNLNFSFISNQIIDKSALGNEFLLPIVTVLHKMNIPVVIGKRKDLWLPGGNKISGTASLVRKNRELHHGTLLFNSDLKNLNQALTTEKKNEKLKGVASVKSKVMNIEQFTANQGGENLQELFISELENYFSAKFQSFSPNEIEEIKKYELKYLSDEWNYKR